MGEMKTLLSLHDALGQEAQIGFSAWSCDSCARDPHRLLGEVPLALSPATEHKCAAPNEYSCVNSAEPGMEVRKSGRPSA